MRLLVILMTFLLLVGFIGFVMTNLDTRVPVTVWKTQYPDLPLFLVVIVAIFAGICYAGIIGVAEGTNLQLMNRRLTREVRRLEAELNYVRTQPIGPPRVEPDVVHDAPGDPSSEPASRRPGPPEPSVATAPVYGDDSEDWSPDDDEDVYTGGRAV